MEQQQDFASIPGLLQEPLDLFHDDVFAGLDEPASGPWPHHSLVGSLVEPAPLLLPQQHQHPGAGMQGSHFPAIDCNLLEEQQWHALEAAAAAGLQRGGHSSGAAQGPAPDVPAVVTACGVAPSSMQHLDASCHAAAAAAEQGVGEPGSRSQHGGMLQQSEQEGGVAVSQPPQLEEPCVHTPAPGWGRGSASSSTRSAQDQAAGSGDDGAADDVAGTAEAAAAPAALCGADAAEAAGSDAPSGSSTAAAAAAAAAMCGSLHAEERSDPDTPSAATTAPSADPSTAAVVPSGNPTVGETPSSGSSLPDIDDVPEEQAGLQDEQQGQQQEEGEQQAEMQLQQEACAEHPPSSQQQPEQPAPTPGVTPLACSAGSLSAPAAGAEEGCQAGVAEADLQPCSHGCAAAAAAAAEAADAGCSGSSEHAHTEQQRSVHADDDFASPCSSWHSCVTASSNQASSMSSKRGFFLPTAAGAAADAFGGAAAVLPGSSTAEQPLSGGSDEPQQPPSTSGVSSPAMVSSLHLALQQQQSQHSEQMAASAVSDDPLTAGLALSVSSLAAGIAAREDHAVAAAATAAAGGADANSAEPGACTSGSQPIAMQQRLLPQQEDLWQDVSPPSFSSSPGLLVSAAAARAEAGSQQQQEQQEQQGQQQEAAAVSDAADVDAEAAAAQQEGGDAVDDDVGHGCFYAAGTGLSMSPEQGFLAQHLGALHRGPGLQHQHQHLGNSSYVLRQSELVDLSLSTSLHPSQMQHTAQQQVHPGWLTAHQQLPPAAAQAVERAVVALNDSYYGQGRSSPSEVFGSAAAGGAPAGARSSSGATAIRRAGAGQQWNRAHTQPQQDQQARHRLPSQAAAGGPGGPFGWPGAAVLGDWFSSTVQQPLAAVASRAAVGVGQRLGMAQHHSSQQHLHGPGRQNSGGTWTAGAAGGGGGGAAAHGGLPPGSSGCGSGVSRLAAADGAAAAGDHLDGACLEEGLDDAVLVEKTSDLPQSLQEQEDEAFRGLLFLGGRDSQGRPVVIVNTDAIPAGHNSAPRDAALAYLLKRLSPVVTRGPYVLVIVALHHGPQFRLLPGVWCVRAYQSLPRAFRKHVKHVILLQPSMLVKAAVTLLYPFVSSKAHAKVKQVQRLLDIDAATSGEVQVPHLGEAFLTTIHHINSTRAHQEDSNAQG